MNDSPTSAAITIVHGRHAHLERQLAGIAAATDRPEDHVVVAMGDPEVADLVSGRTRTRVVELPTGLGALPLARARNLGARTALAGGADILIFLDVDCIPGVEMFGRYRKAVREHPDGHLLFCGPVTYLHPGEEEDPESYTVPHPARPAPPDGSVIVDDRMELFWSLSFAITAADWRRSGGFCETYRGYGGEDTDFAFQAATRGFRIAWVGGAHAYHQHHPISDPPVEHLDEILCNARLFHDRWGVWPMLGWLHAFAAAGLIEFDGVEPSWHRISP
ncbi:glycosyltransferase family 2 protein [Gordonia polyisoprenivorans]|uniref:glycosyltransferase family 2 protein n=1 Tax=Gordonia polyisoprenivorans TaxID=84595 RepID=UPI001B8AF2CF|nr:galactosyltransferase-related protein [Gordonia polyisoprenivorans]QUD81941.1 glycosyltransferase family 2 protein [Gordonia polyisoprenivorans]